MKKINIEKKRRLIFGSYLFVISVLALAFIFINSSLVLSGTGQNLTVTTSLEVGAIYPEILNISINVGSNITLVPNSTQTVLCQAVIEDWNNDTTIWKVNATLFDNSGSSDDPDDNNSHYSNSSCVIDLNASSYLEEVVVDDDYHAVANCSFDVWYYANPTNWNCTVYIEDDTNRSNNETDFQGVNELLAIGLPNSIDYGIVNSTEVSDEKIVLVENVGNVQFNISMNGFANVSNKTDGRAMNCSLGTIDYIDVNYEKYNLSNSTPGVLDLSSFEAAYNNLTSGSSPPVKDLSLDYRQNDTVSDAIRNSYWRIYVPRGVAGTCEGNIEFGATTAVGS